GSLANRDVTQVLELFYPARALCLFALPPWIVLFPKSESQSSSGALCARARKNQRGGGALPAPSPITRLGRELQRRKDSNGLSLPRSSTAGDPYPFRGVERCRTTSQLRSKLRSRRCKRSCRCSRTSTRRSTRPTFPPRSRTA